MVLSQVKAAFSKTNDPELASQIDAERVSQAESERERERVAEARQEYARTVEEFMKFKDRRSLRPIDEPPQEEDYIRWSSDGIIFFEENYPQYKTDLSKYNGLLTRMAALEPYLSIEFDDPRDMNEAPHVNAEFVRLAHEAKRRNCPGRILILEA